MHAVGEIGLSKQEDQEFEIILASYKFEASLQQSQPCLKKRVVQQTRSLGWKRNSVLSYIEIQRICQGKK